jgi:hypothetical protein
MYFDPPPSFSQNISRNFCKCIPHYIMVRFYVLQSTIRIQKSVKYEPFFKNTERIGTLKSGITGNGDEAKKLRK